LPPVPQRARILEGPNVITAESLTRRYGNFLAVDQVSFSIGQGEIVGLLGPNGAGKTTIMKMLTGYLEPSEGHARLDGIDVTDDPKTVQRQIGYLPETLPLYPELRVIDFLDFAAALRGVGRDRAAAVRDAIAATELEEKALDPIQTLSRGFRQRVGVAQAILHRPRFVVLDEPTNGLDPGQTLHMRALVKRLAERATVILSTHIMQEVKAVCGRVMILRNGALVLDEAIEKLTRSERLTLTTDAAPDRVQAILATVGGTGSVELVEQSPGRYHYRIPASGDADDLAARTAAALVSGGFRVYALAPEHRDLETVFREVSEAPATPVVRGVAA
jgi:ABC-2 type transport system ATP-binding protein